MVTMEPKYWTVFFTLTSGALYIRWAWQSSDGQEILHIYHRFNRWQEYQSPFWYMLGESLFLCLFQRTFFLSFDSMTTVVWKCLLTICQLEIFFWWVVPGVLLVLWSSWSIHWFKLYETIECVVYCIVIQKRKCVEMKKVW